MSSQQHWYVVQSQPNAENKAILHLGRQGFATYLPRYQKQRRHAGRIELVAAPLFPRYLFVSIDVGSQRWRSILSTIGVSRVVCNGDFPARVPDQVIIDLKAREDVNSFVQLESSHRFHHGDKICIVDGVFAGCMGLFDGMPDSVRVAILLDLLGRKTRVAVDAMSVTAA